MPSESLFSGTIVSMRFRVWFFIFGLGLLAFAQTQSQSSQPPAPDWTIQPQVLAVVLVQPDGLHFVTWTFDRVVPHAKVREYLKLFTEFSQKNISKISIRDDSLKRNASPKERFTQAEFYTSGFVDTRQGTFWLDPFIRTFAGDTTLHFYALLPGSTEYHGYPYYEDSHLQAWTIAEPAVWRCIVQLKSHDPALLTIPLLKPETKQETTPTGSKPATGLSAFPAWGVVLSFIIAFFAGVGIYWLMRRNIQSSVRHTPPKAAAGRK